MHLTLVISSLAAGGAERVICDIANHWAERNHKVTLITLTGPDIQDFYPLHYSVERVWLCLAKVTRNLFDKVRLTVLRVMRLRQVVRHASSEVVLSFMDVNNVYVLLATIGLKSRVIVSERTDPGANYQIRRPWALLRKLLYRRADVVVAQTAAAAGWLNEHCGTRAVVIPNAVRDLPAIDLGRKREKMVLAVGRLSDEKGYDVLVRAFSRVVVRHPDWRLIILGQGPGRGALEEMALGLGIRDSVDLHGTVEDPEEWMARAGLFVMTSRFEGFPNALLEAMAVGAAVISTDCRSGPRELVSDGINGRLVAVDDVENLAEVMNGLMSNRELREKMGERATDVRQRFARAEIMKRWETVFLGTVASRSGKT